MPAISWNIGELSLHRRLNPSVSSSPPPTSPSLNYGHKAFLTSPNFLFFPVATLDEEGRPWASIIFGEKQSVLDVDPFGRVIVTGKTCDGDPFEENRDSEYVAGLAIDLKQRRRVKLAGKMERLEGSVSSSSSSDDIRFAMKVEEALFNCPKYIYARSLHHAGGLSSPSSVLSSHSPSDKPLALPDDVISFISRQTSLFIATSTIPLNFSSASSPPAAPPRLGLNIRGGQAGFVRSLPPSDIIPYNTLHLLDLSGNKFQMSLGNIEIVPHAGLVFPDWETGDVLFITGDAKNFVGEEAKKLVRRVPAGGVVTQIAVRGWRFVKGGLPLRSVGQAVESPYSPPVTRLMSEVGGSGDGWLTDDERGMMATLKKIKVHSKTIQTFEFEVGDVEKFKPKAGDYVVMDLTALVGRRIYSHMSDGDERTINDDRIRSWTISSTPTPSSFTVTLARAPNGLVTSELFTLAAHLPSFTPASVLDISLPILGFGGEFHLPSSPSSLICVAGGIGVTPFLSFLRDIVSRLPKEYAEGDGALWKIDLIIATREAAAIVPLVYEAISSGPSPSSPPSRRLLDLHLRIFSTSAFEPKLPSIPTHINVDTKVDLRRPVVDDFKKTFSIDLTAKVYFCGGAALEKIVLKAAGEREVQRESFAF